MKTKKAQFYLFAAIILVSFAFLIVSTSKIIDSQEFKESKNLLNNYKYEAKIIMDNAIYAKKNITDELKNYTLYFIDYGKTKNKDLQILFLYSYEQKVYIVNYLNQPVLISTNLVGVRDTLSLSSEEVSVLYKNETYRFNFELDNPEFKVLFIGE